MDYNVAMQKKGFVFMIIMSVDLGKARTGIAVCDKTEFLASPYTVIFEKSPKALPNKVAQAAKDVKAELIVVGLPKNMDGTEGARAELCREFAGKLEEATGLPVKMWDERRTTVEAHNILSQHNYHGKKRKDTVDAVAASLILEGYLAFRGR